jgi:hypothetical protein
MSLLVFEFSVLVVFNIAEALKSWMMENNSKQLTEHELVVKRKMERSELKNPDAAFTNEAWLMQYLVLFL